MLLIEDVKQIVLSELAKIGFVYSDSDSTDLLLNRYLNLKSKLVELKPRNVVESKELLARRLPNYLNGALEKLKQKIIQGHDISCHLSKKAVDPDEPDFLLYDWAIHHFHLSDTKVNPDDYFFDRSDYLLFAIITDENAFLIDVFLHNERNVFAKRHLLSMVQKYWPQLLEPYEIKGIVALEHNPSDEEIDRLRRAGVNVTIELNGKFYVPMGGGLTTAKTSVTHRLEINKLIHWLRQVEEHIQTHQAEIIDKINNARRLNLNTLQPRVRLINERFVVVEDQSDIMLT